MYTCHEILLTLFIFNRDQSAQLRLEICEEGNPENTHEVAHLG